MRSGTVCLGDVMLLCAAFLLPFAAAMFRRERDEMRKIFSLDSLSRRDLCTLAVCAASILLYVVCKRARGPRRGPSGEHAR